MAKRSVAKKKGENALQWGWVAVAISCFLVIATYSAVKAYGPTGLVIQGSVNQNR